MMYFVAVKKQNKETKHNSNKIKKVIAKNKLFRSVSLQNGIKWCYFCFHSGKKNV